MRRMSPTSIAALLLIATTLPASVATASQTPEPPASDLRVTVYGSPKTKGPDLKGIISARKGDQLQITSAEGTRTVVALDPTTRIRASKGLFGLDRNQLAGDLLVTGLPVTVKTQQSGAGLTATEISLQQKDLKTAAMIHSATAQRFEEQAAATEALRGRMADIDQYNVKSTTNVNFDTGKAVLSEQAKQDLCAVAATAEAMDNALLLVVGYTDSTGSDDYNQQLSEKRAGRVVKHLQQACGWKPYRMLTPTGMSEADPMADNETEEGKAMNRRVAVNVLVSKGLDGL